MKLLHLRASGNDISHLVAINPRHTSKMKTDFSTFTSRTRYCNRKLISRNEIWRYQQNHRQILSTMAMPVFLKQNSDGSEEEVSEEEIYQHTPYRWLCNESENLSKRYRKFNILALAKAAVDAAGDDAKSCVKLLKCVEGQFNKAFIMTMDNGAEVVAKVPNPNAGPPFYTIASEVATRQFLGTVLGLPVPCIYAHAEDSLNPVGTEFIIEEKAEGKPLGSLWSQWQPEAQLNLIAQLVDFETKLSSTLVRQHGCIYCKQDLMKKGVPAYDMEADSLSAELTKESAFGPLTEARLWEDERETMKLDRGPWSSPLLYMRAMGINEIQWAKAYAKPQLNVYRSLEALHSPDNYISLLERYLQLVPHIPLPSFRTSFSHPDLHLDNIFVNPDTMEITSIIDWQSASVSEPFFKQSVPRMLQLVGSRSSGEPGSNKTPDLLGHYRNLSRSRNEQRCAATNLRNRSLLMEPVSLLCGAWSKNGAFSFRHALIYIAARWKEISATPCPLQFTEDELNFHNDELDLIEGLGEVLHQLQNDNLTPLGAMVLRENYEHAAGMNIGVKEMFVDMAESESQKELYSRVWPYQDRDS